jgi:hypothetical protein
MMLLLSLSLSSYLQFGLYKVTVIAQVVINHVTDNRHLNDEDESDHASIAL